MSADLVWSIIRGGNSFLVKRNGFALSSESGNLRNIHSFKYSGVANRGVVAVDADAKTGEVLLKVKKTSGSAHKKPASAFAKIALKKKNFRKNAAAVAKNAAAIRPDLKAAALARFSAISKSKKASGVAKKTRTRRGVKKTA
eukprot:tig00020710_g13357.t1